MHRKPQQIKAYTTGEGASQHVVGTFSRHIGAAVRDKSL